jgi:YD repeat-containing protein
MNTTSAFHTGLRRLLYPAVAQPIPPETNELAQLADLLHRLDLTVADYQTLPLMHRTIDGRSVDVATGEVVLETTDVTIPGPVPFAWGRCWRSGHLTGGSVGTGWRHTYDYVLLEDRRTRQVLVRMPDNRAVLFPLLTDNESALNRREKIQLTRDGQGYALQPANGLRYHFADNPSGSLCRLITVERPGVVYRLQFTYNQLGHLFRISDGGQRVIELTTNAGGHIGQLTLTASDVTQQRIVLAQYRYDDTHNLTEAAVYDRLVMQYHYRQRQIIRLTDQLRQSIFFAYASVDKAVRCIEVRREAGRVVQFRYLIDEGRTLVTDEAGHVRQYIHEAGVVQRFMSAEGRQRVWFHNEYNELISEQDPLGNTTFLTYNDRGNLTQTAWPDGGTMVMAYDTADQLLTLTDRAGGVWQWSYSVNGQLLSCIDPAGAELKFSYNLTGLLTEQQTAGLAVRWEYDASANPVQQSNAAGQVNWSFDALGRLTFAGRLNETRPLFPVDQSLSLTVDGLTTEYQPAYDADGLLIRLRRGRLNWQFIRDAAGGIREYTRPDGQSTRFHYDAAGRLTEALFGDGSWCHYAYRPDGWLIEATSPTTQVTIVRDAQGRILKEEADEQSMQSGYDLAGSRISQQSSSGAEVTFTYNVQGQLTKLTHPVGSLLQTHDRQGRLTEQVWPGGLRCRWQYNDGRVPVSQSVYWGSQLHAERVVTYGWAGRQLSRLQDSRFGTVDLRYGPADEVVEAVSSSGWTERWVADRYAYQQRLLRPAPDTVEPGWQLIVVGALRFYYDADGYLREKRVAGQTWVFQWHESGTLERIIRPDRQAILFTYDALGRRISKTLGDKIVRWSWDGNRLAHEWHQQGDDVPVQLTWFTTDRAVPVLLQVGNQFYSVICNQLGQPLSIHAPTGEPIWTYGWYLFGKKHGLTGPAQWHTYLGSNQFDVPEAGLVYADFRYIDADTGLPLSPEYSSPAGWAQARWVLPHAPESYLSAARYIRVY